MNLYTLALFAFAPAGVLAVWRLLPPSSYLWNRLTRVFGWKNYSFSVRRENQPGFIVFNPDWPDPPRKWFQTLTDAKHAAEHLARKQPGDTFIIMKAVAEISAVTTVKELPGGER